MCGIVGFTGNRQAAPILLDGLSKLEYRGYDSAGLAVRDGENLAQVVKAKGRLSNLIEKTDGGKALKGTCGIGHTRWATHGEPSQTNAHPHVSGNCIRSGSGTVESEVVGVHNGIIENYTELKEKLLKHGYTFYSQTDTEVVIKLVDYYYKKYNLGPIDAIAKTMVRVRGSYALELMFRDYPGEIWVARKDSLAFVVGGAMAGIFGVIVGVPVLRLSGDYLAIVTLAFGEIIKNIMNAVYLGVDDSGLHFSLKDAASMNMAEDGKILINGAMGITGIKKTSTFTMGIILVLITLVVVLNLIRSRAGRAISAIRDNEIAAKSIGINITRYKLMAFVLSSVFAGMAGVLYSLNYSSLVAKKFDYNTSINILVFVVLGGIGSIRGSVIAAAILTVLPEMLRGLNDYRMLIYAIVLIVMMIFTRSPKLVAWRKEVAEKIAEKFPILKLNKFLKDKSKKEAA